MKSLSLKIVKAMTGESSVVATLVKGCQQTAIEFTNADGDLVAFRTNNKELIFVS